MDFMIIRSFKHLDGCFVGLQEIHTFFKRKKSARELFDNLEF